ncbi:unnamed protein product [Agarophyton chilense]
MHPLSLFLGLLATLPSIRATQNALSHQPPLRCCFMEEKPISFKNDKVFTNNGLDGAIADHVLQLQSYLNWSCSTTVLFKETDSSDFNAFVNSCTVFSHIGTAKVSGKMWFFLLTFDAKAWVSILDTYSKFQRCSHFFMKSPLLFRCRKALQSSLMRMLLLSDDRVVENGNTTRQWLLNIFISVCALFLILSYEASMTASLLQESFSSQYQSVSDIHSCRVKPSDICIIKGGAMETYWNDSLATDPCHENDKPKFMNSHSEMFQAVQSSRCLYGIAMETVLNNANRETYCNSFVSLGEPFQTGGLSMLLPKNSNLTQPMSLGVLALLRNQTKSYLNKYLNTLPNCRADVNTNLSFTKLRLFFFLAFGFGVVIFLEMLFVPQQIIAKQDNKVSCVKDNQVNQTRSDSINRDRSPSLSTASHDTNT